MARAWAPRTIHSRPPSSCLHIGFESENCPFFCSFTTACRLANDLLFRAGSAEAVDNACRQSPVGKLLPNALYVHRTARRSARSASPTRDE